MKKNVMKKNVMKKCNEENAMKKMYFRSLKTVDI